MKQALALVAAALAALASTLNATAAVRYVDLNCTNATPPFTNWATAATTIQDAVDAASAGDEIVVTNGVYQTGGRAVNGNLPSRLAVDKPLTVRSVNGPAMTVIRGNSPIGNSAVRCVYLASGATIAGFTLSNGATRSSNEENGGGAWCESTSAVLSNCVLTGNSASSAGGGAYYGTLNNCRLTGNHASQSGGGAYMSNLKNCTLTGNLANWYGGGACSATLLNCIVYYNTAFSGGSNYYSGSLAYCCTTPRPSGGTAIFINAPLFVNLASGDFRLQTGSPCINTGNNAYAVGVTDLDGRPRVVGGVVDVGAYEYQGPYLNAAATVGGSVARDPDESGYPLGSSVSITATPATGYGFIRWTGDASGSTSPLTVTMNTDKTITAVFASTALALASQGIGTIAKAPDKPFYDVGEQVTLTATAGRWHVFSNWTDRYASNPRTITIGESNAYTAVFTPTTPLETVAIGGVSRLAPVGMPAVVVDGLFILTPSASARGLALVTLSTTFPGGTLFYTLDGRDPALSGAIYSGPLTVRKPSGLRTLAYDATFSRTVAGDPLDIIILPTLTVLTPGGGSLAIAPPSGAYFSNELATVTATAKPGWTFLQWLGDATGSNPAVNLSMTRSKSVRAVFGTTLTTAAVGGGNIVASPVSPLHPYGSLVRLTPVPSTGNYLAQWANAAAGRTSNPLSFTVTNANPTVTAVFASLGTTQTNALAVIPDGRGQVTLTPPGNRYRLNTNVVLQATADAGQEFLGWSGAATGNQNPLTVTMNSNKVITASFTKRPWLRGEGNPDLLRQEGFRLTLTGEFSTVYQLFGSLDLSDWTALGTVSNAWGTVQFTDPDATNSPGRFYRARAAE